MIGELVGYISMACIILCYYLAGKKLKLSQRFALAGNFIYIIYGLLISQYPVIILGVILTIINAYTLNNLRKEKK